ncbi:MAG: hypothetical protein JOZ69_01215 [Myxococcales bacterium]|nr:hypothetical protein [Myxococcales bacterium]
MRHALAAATARSHVPWATAPAAWNAAAMLVAQAITVVQVGTLGSSFASSQASRARLLYARFGRTLPQTPRSIRDREA